MSLKKRNNIILCSVGICVYNEEKNITGLLDSLLHQKLKRTHINEILVISSGSTDKTLRIIKEYSKNNRKIKIVTQKRREGKASAVNIFIKKAKNNVLVLLGGDMLPTPQTIEKLVSKFANKEIGMTGGRPIPINNVNDSFCGFAGNLMWELHHRISLKRPKMGEVIAFRKLFKRISTLVGADEAIIEPIILGQGYKIVYVPTAKIYNKTPTTIKDFITQRRRNYWLHLGVKNKQYYMVSTLDASLVLFALLSFLKENPKLKYIVFSVFVAILEAYSRLLGWWDYSIAKRKHTVWKIVESTKNLG